MNVQLLWRIKVGFRMLLLLVFMMNWQLPQANSVPATAQDEVLLVEAIQTIGKKYHVLFSYDRAWVKDITVLYDPAESNDLNEELEMVLNQTDLKYRVFDSKYVAVYRDKEVKTIPRKNKIPKVEYEPEKEKKAAVKRNPREVSTLSNESLHELYLHKLVINVSGTVMDASGAPLIGVNVLVQGTDNGTSTDLDGRFTLEDLDENAILVFSYIGYQTQQVALGGRTNLLVTMVEDLTTLEEVVVVGYGTQLKKDLTGSVAVVDVRDMKAQPAASPIESLQGKATGVHIINDGAPGATPQIRIRGFSTINNNNPLYIIDGVPYEGKLSWLNSSDIESLQVLKDASAASIYGARANNGVVIITTKNGQPGDPKISFNMYYGTQRPNRSRFPEFLNPQQYGEYVYQRYINAGKTPGLTGTTGTNYGSDPLTPVLPDYLVAGTKTGHEVTAADADPSKYNYSLEDPSQFYQITKANKEGTNWFEEITRNAPMQNYQLSISGGTDKSSYALSGGFFDQKGTFKYTKFKRYTLRSNTSFKLFNDRVTIGENFQYSHTSGNGFGVNENTSGSYQGEASPIGWAYRIQTIVPVYDIKGNFGGTRGDKLGNADNPLAILYRGKDNINNSNQLFGNTYADIQILDDLKFRTNFGLRYEEWGGKSIGYPNPERSEASFDNNVLNEYQGDGQEWTWTNTLTYAHNFNDIHRLTVLAGTEAIKGSYHSLNGSGRDFFVTGDLNYYYINTAASNSAGSSGGTSSLFSIFGRVDYSFMSKYLLSATLRRDGSSNFGPENRFGLFPAASAAWRLSEESFTDNAVWMDDMKIRAGYGVTGNQSIPSFQYLRRFASSINSSSYPITGGELASGLWTSNYDNAAIKWEERTSVNVGLDYSLFNYAIDGSIDWFSTETDGVLYPVPQPTAAVGKGSSPFINSGDIKNTGIEFAINYHHNLSANSDAFAFDIGASISSYKNTLVNLAPTVSEQPYLTLRGVTTSIMKAGAPLGAFYGYQVIGINQSESDIESSATYTGARVGGFKYEDVSGPEDVPDGIIDGFDRTVIGNPHPDFIYSLSFNAAYKNFDLTMFFNGTQGNELFDLTRQYTDFYAFPGAVSVRTLDAWSPENPESMIPSAYDEPPTIEFQSSSYYVQDGSFFRMKNLQLGYTLPVEDLFNSPYTSLRVYVSATNLFTITSYSGMDPEVSQYSSTFTAPGVDMGVYPIPRQYLVGVNISL